MEFKKKHDLFVFTSGEKKGIIVLVFILLILMILEFVLPRFLQPDSTDFSEWEKTVDEYLATQNLEKEPSSLQLSFFDPNKTDSVRLSAIGLPPRVAGNWQKYLKKGGSFKSKEEVLKIYGMTPEIYNQIQSYLVISEKKFKENLPFKVKSGKVLNRQSNPENIQAPRQHLSGKADLAPLDLNRADSAALEKLPGIGPVLASRIVRFRSLMGGFYNIAQLHEVYGLRDEHFNLASPYLFVGEIDLKKININFSNLTEMGRHPYIGFHAARSILKLRDQRGKIRSADELIMFKGDSLSRLKPYLVFHEGSAEIP